MCKGKTDEKKAMYQRLLPFWRLLAVFFILGWLIVNSRADSSDRRQIIVFAMPESESGELIRRSAGVLRCQLVDRDTDIRFVDITELPDTDATMTSEKRDETGVLVELTLLRSKGRPDFEVVLIGKDGGVKARTSDPNALENFLALIDTMPMRRAEMRSRGRVDAACDREY